MSKKTNVKTIFVFLPKGYPILVKEGGFRIFFWQHKDKKCVCSF